MKKLFVSPLKIPLVLLFYNGAFGQGLTVGHLSESEDAFVLLKNDNVKLSYIGRSPN